MRVATSSSTRPGRHERFNTHRGRRPKTSKGRNRDGGETCGGAADLTYGDLVAVGLEREHNFSDMARTLLMGESNFLLPCDFKELRVAKRAHISTSALCA
jgi:hypothetical protein